MVSQREGHTSGACDLFSPNAVKLQMAVAFPSFFSNKNLFSKELQAHQRHTFLGHFSWHTCFGTVVLQHE